jgi:hypothetical protein
MNNFQIRLAHGAHKIRGIAERTRLPHIVHVNRDSAPPALIGVGMLVGNAKDLNFRTRLL